MGDSSKGTRSAKGPKRIARRVKALPAKAAAEALIEADIEWRKTLQNDEKAKGKK
jgi:hypothetical protein